MYEKCVNNNLKCVNNNLISRGFLESDIEHSVSYGDAYSCKDFHREDPCKMAVDKHIHQAARIFRWLYTRCRLCIFSEPENTDRCMGLRHSRVDKRTDEILAGLRTLLRSHILGVQRYTRLYLQVNVIASFVSVMLIM